MVQSIVRCRLMREARESVGELTIEKEYLCLNFRNGKGDYLNLDSERDRVSRGGGRICQEWLQPILRV